MRKFWLLLTMLSVSFVVAGQAQQCRTIQSNTLVGSDGVALDTGFDQWGYNYQAMTFNGKYCDAYRDAAWCQPNKPDELLMKWNEAWLSNQDCNGDGKLDRHHGFTSFIGSGAWLTNHQKGVYTDSYGKKQRWNYFVKIVAAPADAALSGGIWYMYDVHAQEQVAIGPVIWGEFAIVLEVYNDTGTGDHGVLFKSPRSAGFGFYGPHQ